MRSLQSRLLLTYLLVAGLVLTLLAGSLAVFLAGSPVAVQDAYRRMDLVSRLLVQRETRGVLGQGSGRLGQVLRRLELPLGRMILVDPDGSIVVDSAPEEPLPPADALAGPPGQGEFDRVGQVQLYTRTALDNGQTLILILPRPRVRLATLLGEDVGRPFLRAGLVALAASIVLAWLIARWVARPLQELAHATGAVAAGDYSVLPPVEGPTEVRSLATAFANMVARVRAGQQAQRDFVANVSHEMRTPLTSIQGFAQAIRDGDAGDQAGVRRAGTVIFEESDRLRRLVDDLLDLARLDAGQLPLAREPVELGSVARAVAERLSLPAAERDVRLAIEIPPLPSVIGDGDRLAQVLTNLIDNAIRHSPSRGTVSVRGALEGAWIALRVDDEGPGIPPDELSRIFERFYQVDKARAGGEGRGTGLGLAISKEIVDAHGGRIVAESKPAGGSRFTVRLPAATPEDPTPVRRRRI